MKQSSITYRILDNEQLRFQKSLGERVLLSHLASKGE